MARARDTKVTLPCTRAQKAELERRAKEHGLSVSNYLRLLLGWPFEQQGCRKDLKAEAESSAMQQDTVCDTGESRERQQQIN